VNKLRQEYRRRPIRSASARKQKVSVAQGEKWYRRPPTPEMCSMTEGYEDDNPPRSYALELSSIPDIIGVGSFYQEDSSRSMHKGSS
jgi:hypothetical protein